MMPHDASQQTMRLVLEPSGAVGIVALLAYPQFMGQLAATILCGGNLREKQMKVVWL